MKKGKKAKKGKPAAEKVQEKEQEKAFKEGKGPDSTKSADQKIQEILKKDEDLLAPLQDAVEKKAGKVIAYFTHDHVITENTDAARDLYSQSRYGTILDGGKVQLSLIEAHYLKEKGKIDIIDTKGKHLPTETFLAKAKKLEHNFWVKYCVYKDIRNRGYIIKTALKFGADFRVYDRGVKPGEDHARWVVFPIHEGQTLTWHDFAAKNRVAHSTKKRLMIGIVDAEMDVTYYEIRWIRP